MALNSGDTLLNGQYRILGQLGRGGFGFAYQAEDTLLHKEVAIKELNPALLGDEGALKRFLIEARATMELTHERIVRTYNVFQESGRYYIVMECMAGGSLEALLQARGPLPPDEAVQVAAAVAEALAYAHGRGVVHCDLKPANILFDRAGRAKVADFGIAHVAPDMLTRTWQTSAGFVAGTLPYMSPEQADGVRDDPRLDLYALGAVLYRMLTGRPYLEFDERDTPGAQADNVHRIRREAPQPPSAANRRLPAWLDRVVLRLLAKRPEDRYAGAAAARAALLAGEEPTALAAPSPLPGVERPVSRPAAPPPGQRPAASPPSRPRAAPPPARPRSVWFLAGGAAILLVVLGVAVAALLSGGAEATPTPPAPVAAVPTAVRLPAATPAPTLRAASPTETAPAAAAARPALILLSNLDGIITLDPHRAYGTAGLMIHASTYDTLVELGPDDLVQVIPRLAEQWDISADGLTYTFHLRPGAKFSSGNPVTAEDVRFSWTRLKNLQDSPAFYADLVAEVKAVDDLTVQAILTKPAAAFLSICAAPAMGIVDSRVVRAHGGTDAPDADQTDRAKDWLDHHSAGSGPFIQVGWTPGAEVVLEANPNYWRGAPKLGRVVIRHVPDSPAALQLIQAGDADLYGALDPAQVEAARADPNLSVIVAQTLSQTYLAMTSGADLSAPLADKRVRKAIALSVGYDRLIDALLGGYGRRAPSILPLGVPGVDPAMTQGRDLDQARALLREAGYEAGFAVDLSYASNATRERIAAELQSSLAEVGITVNLKPMEMSAYWVDLLTQKLAMTIGGWVPDYIDPTSWTDYFCYADRGMAQWMRYNSPRAQEQARIVDTVLDPATREAALVELQKVLMDEVPFTMLYQYQAIIVMNKAVQGFTYHPLSFVNLAELSK